ncbi:hypothetical protein BDA99DRAFT_595153 [Phascolomyces articulosus]|uniref:F-box domain-containing protein n=1 Tax=Phascolomyces articulosus TaxID=60185 RepID=A0AAD5KHN1_9FUNG|nr:hypothetical protein BDA99DRAFT_595153 [Phascolomyces articulosus]
MGLDLKIHRPWTTIKAITNPPSLKHKKHFHCAATTASGPLPLQQKRDLQQPTFLPTIYRLSDDVLLYLLLCPELDFKSLHALAQVSLRFRQIVCQLLQVYLLPDLQLTTMIDQEGRGRWTCRYQFQSLDETTLCATFTPDIPASRQSGRGYVGSDQQQKQQCFQRYKCDGSTDAPTLRHIQVHHYDMVLSSSLFVKETRRYREKITHSKIEEKQHHSNTTTPTTASSTILPSDLSCSSSSPMMTCITRQTRRVGIRRCGIRSIRARHFQERLVAKIHPHVTYASSSSLTTTPAWQFTYSVSTQQPIVLGADDTSSSNSSSTNNSSMSLILAHDQHHLQEDINSNKHDARSPCLFNNAASAKQHIVSNQNHKNSRGDTTRYFIPICLTVDVSMLGQRSSCSNYKRFMNHLPSFCWIRRKWALGKQTTP